MNRKSFKWLLLLVPVLLIAVILAAVFWEAIVIRVAPKAVLTSALTKVFSQLEERFRDDPLLILARSFDPDGRYTADMQMKTEKELLGQITYDMTVQTDGTAHQLLATGTARTSSKALDLSVYMDADFMAVSSEGLVNGNYYGITYDTFASDLRKIPLLNVVVSDSLLSQWDDSVQGIQEKMSRTYALPKLPEASREDVQKLLLGMVAMPCQIEKCSILLNGDPVTCYKLDYSASGQQVSGVLSQITDGDFSEDVSVTASFYLYQNAVVKLLLICEAGESSMRYSLDLGLNPAEDVLTLQSIENRNGQFEGMTVAVTTQNRGNCYAETWEGHKTSGGETSQISFAYEWDPESGDMLLTPDGSSESLSLNLTETEDGFRIVTNDFSRLMQAIIRDPLSTSKASTVSCTMTVTKGSEIVTPAYKNLDQWSMEDFFTLLGGIGALIGINIG